jgi:RNA polymerase sigma factor (sigma-70 family)
MRPFAPSMDHEPLNVVEDADRRSPADAERRLRFLAEARPALDRAYRLAGLILGDGHEAEDAVQDALAVAWQSFDRLRQADRFGAWFDRILVNNCRDRMRRRRIVRFIPIEGATEPVGGDPFQALIDRDAILGGLGELTPDERAVIVLRFWADLPLEGIAERMDWPLGTVKSRLHRALARLRAAFEAGSRAEVAR